jgi:hypothetical protein
MNEPPAQNDYFYAHLGNLRLWRTMAAPGDMKVCHRSHSSLLSTPRILFCFCLYVKEKVEIPALNCRSIFDQRFRRVLVTVLDGFE